MPNSLMDMFQPRGLADNQPVGFGDALAQNRQSLIGLGMGLLQPISLAHGAPAQSPMGNALGGYQQGAAQDARQAYAQAQLAHTKRQEAFQRSQAAQAQSNFERTFSEGQMTEADKLARSAGLHPGTPEHQAFVNKAIQSKSEGDWQVVNAPHPIYPGETVPVWANKRTRETVPFTPGSTAPDTATAQQGPTQPGAAPPGGGIPPAPPGSDPKEWRKEQTKLRVQQQTAEEARKRLAGSIDPVTEDIDRAINQTKQFPGMIAGTFGNLLKNVPGSQARDVSNLVDTIKANASLDKLSAMRAASPTGASGLGAVTQGEHKILQDSIGALDQSQTPEQFLFNLDRVKRIRHEIIHGPGTAPPSQFELPASQRPQGGDKPAPPKPGFVKGGYVFKGGDPADEANWAVVRK